MLLAGHARAHPPDSIAAEYDTLVQTLKIRIMHNVKDAQKHYINKVEVKINGSKKVEQSSSRQSDNTAQELVYRIIEAKPGDRLTVEARCNITGKLKAEFIFGPGLMNPPPD
jgi:hypothetical protein